MTSTASTATAADAADAAGDEIARIVGALAAPFDATEVKWKPQTISGTRALTIGYVDARVIQDRLDEVVGVEGWQDRYTILPDGAVVCRLRVKLGDRWITKEDVGGQSEQPDEGDRRKAAFSDALKRAAVKFGIGRYLYRLEPQWLDYDPQKRRVVGTPRLPASALPAKAAKPQQPPHQPQPRPAPQPQQAPQPASSKGMPSDGKELRLRLEAKDQSLAAEGLCQPGDLLRHVVEAGVKKGLGKDLAAWAGGDIPFAVGEVRAFVGLAEKRAREAAAADEAAEREAIQSEGKGVASAGGR